MLGENLSEEMMCYKSQETTVFSGRQKLNETEARKMMVDSNLMLYTGKSS